MKKSLSFLDTYLRIIVPKLKTLDILLKYGDEIPLEEVEAVLEISGAEIFRLLKIKSADYLTSNELRQLISLCDCEICTLIKREINCGLPTYYTPKDISYIYGLNEDRLKKAFDFLGIKEATDFDLPAIFLQIRN